MSGPFDLDTKTRVKEATDIVDLVQRFMPLQKKGASFVGHCPWHDDKSPSFQVDQRRQSWVCWVCNIRGDIFDFVMRRENVEFFEALKMLAEWANIPIQTNGRKVVKGSANDKQTLYEACRWAESQFHRCLLDSHNGDKAREYLEQRGIDSELIDTFNLGFAPAAYNWLTELAKDTSFTNDVLQACGLIVKNENSHSWYERFRGRLIFPIRDTMERPIAFGGRLVPGIFEPDKEPPGKYINSPETRLFSKSDTLYGLNIVKNELNRTKELTVVEGYTDVIGAWRAGLRNVVAVLGTALNARHIKLIKRYADRINLVLDGDTAGMNRANQILDLFVAENVDLRIVSLPDNADPFDYLQAHDKAEFSTVVARAPDAFDHKMKAETAGIDVIKDTHAANIAMEKILSTLAKVPTSLTGTKSSVLLKHGQMLAKVSKHFRVDLEEVRRRLQEIRRKQRPAPRLISEEVEPVKTIDVSKLVDREVNLLSLLLLDNSILDEVIENISPDQFVQGPLKKLYEEICECFHNAEDIAFESLMLRFNSLELKNLIAQLNDLASQRQEETAIEIRKQLEYIFAAFDKQKITEGNRSAISEIEQKQESEPQEDVFDQLEKLRQQKQQRLGL